MLAAGTKLERVSFARAPRWLSQAAAGRRIDEFDRKDRAMWLGPSGLLGPRAARGAQQLPTSSSNPSRSLLEHWNQRYRAMTTLRDIEAEPSVVIPVMDKLRANPVVGTFAASEARAAQKRRWRTAVRGDLGDNMSPPASSARREVPKPRVSALQFLCGQQLLIGDLRDAKQTTPSLGHPTGLCHQRTISIGPRRMTRSGDKRCQREPQVKPPNYRAHRTPGVHSVYISGVTGLARASADVGCDPERARIGDSQWQIAVS